MIDENGGFRFGHRVIINSETYNLNSNIEEVGKAMINAAESIKRSNNDNEIIMNAAREAIDVALGSGSFDKITNGLNINSFDLVDLVGHIANEVKMVKEARERMINSFMTE